VACDFARLLPPAHPFLVVSTNSTAPWPASSRPRLRPRFDRLRRKKRSGGKWLFAAALIGARLRAVKAKLVRIPNLDFAHITGRHAEPRAAETARTDACGPPPAVVAPARPLPSGEETFLPTM